jgi:AraC-like DNA-binding protein
MSFISRRARPSLAGIVDRVWRVEDDGRAAQSETICPDGRTEIVMHLAEPMRELRGRAVHQQPRQLLVGQMTAPVAILPGGRVRMIGARLAPGALHRLLPIPQQELAGRILDLADVWPRWTRELGERAAGASGDDELGVLESALETMLQRTTACESVRSTMVAAARIDRAGGNVSIDALAHAAGMSRRQFERRFREHVGLPPRLFGRVIRFQRAFRAVGIESGASIAARCGFADQAHLVHEIRRFSGQTPTLLADASQLTRFFRSEA